MSSDDTGPQSFADRIDDLLHAETQVHDRGVDLTAAEIAVVDLPGRVDFGGGELEAAATSPVETHYRSEDDDYAWWHLDAGQYLLSFNESLSGEGDVLMQTRDAMRRAGVFHPTLVVSAFEPVPLSVGEGGVRIKENARVTTVLESGSISESR
ncbi:dCTP deaminase [Halobium salinum]|uniref:dCTP deaminase n=1 Tax=Halobium salinum TaxID=1364940 RepID=A0ABD5P8N1_9EURY|nr:dCTP deaminase [Halobium salinum]